MYGYFNFNVISECYDVHVLVTGLWDVEFTDDSRQVGTKLKAQVTSMCFAPALCLIHQTVISPLFPRGSPQRLDDVWLWGPVNENSLVGAALGQQV